MPGDVSIDELHEIAVSNLDRDIEYVLRETNFGGYMLTAGGDHEAGAICSRCTWPWLAEHLGDDLIISIPAKDLVLILPQKDTENLEAIKAFIEMYFKMENASSATQFLNISEQASSGRW